MPSMELHVINIGVLYKNGLSFSDSWILPVVVTLHPLNPQEYDFNYCCRMVRNLCSNGPLDCSWVVGNGLVVLYDYVVGF